MTTVTGILSVLALAVAVAAYAVAHFAYRRRGPIGYTGADGRPGPMGPKGDCGPQGEPGYPGTLRFDVEKLTDDEVDRIAERVLAGLPDDDDLGESGLPDDDTDSDPVNRPSHYTRHPVFGIEAIEVTRQLDFSRGNAVKYLWRAGRKGSTRQDVEKALWYIDDALAYENVVDPATSRYLNRCLTAASLADLDPGEVTAASSVVQIATGCVSLDYVAGTVRWALDQGWYDPEQ